MLAELSTRKEKKQASAITSGKDINPTANCPDMLPSGSSRPTILIYGECPGEAEDANGEQFIGKSGKLLRAQFPKWLTKDLRFDNVVRTRTVTERGSNRTPTKEEIDFYSPRLIEDIAATKPKIVLLAGGIPLSWALLGQNITVARGRRFPITIGGHKTWLFPVHHPSFILRVELSRTGEIPGIELKRTWINDLKAVVSFAQEENYYCPEPLDQDDFQKDILCLTDIDSVLSALDFLRSVDKLAFDFETSTLRPYTKGARIVSMAFASAGICCSFPFDTEQPTWVIPGQREAILEGIEQLFRQRLPQKIAHNLPFELEWLISLFGTSIARASEWADTESESFVLDERPGGHDLGFCTSLHLGFNVKTLSNINIKNIDSNPLEELLRYNALDAKATYEVHLRQQEQIATNELGGILWEHIRRLPTLVLAQVNGLLVDSAKQEEYRVKLDSDLGQISKKILDQPEIQTYQKQYGTVYNYNSVPQNVKLFRDILGRKEGIRGHKYSTDKKALAEMKGVKLAKLLLELRATAKLKGSYVDKMVVGKLVYPDNRLHPIFNSTRTVTGRLSAKSPSCQNFPKRKYSEIRSQIIADPGCLLVSADLAQIEARCIGMASKDSFLCKSIKEKYDIHADWAERIIKLSPRTYEKRGSDFKKFRSEIKNELVFPLFYGSQPVALASRLEIDLVLAKKIYNDFWRMFPGVLNWQKSLMQSYRELGYVTTMTGRRRHAPMSPNMVYNSCIQGSSSDLTVDAMNRLSESAEREAKPWLQAVLNVHDDLTFCIPEGSLEEAIEAIVLAMTTYTYAWVTLPVGVEVSVGKDWGSLVAIGNFG